MKKRIALFLAALFTFSMVTTSAFASDVDAHTECNHSSVSEQKIAIYYGYDND